MEMLRQNLKRQASRSLSALASATSPRGAAADQENLHPNVAYSPPASPAKTSSAKDWSPLPKQHPKVVAQPAAAAVDNHPVAPAVNVPSVKVTRPICSTLFARVSLRQGAGSSELVVSFSYVVCDDDARRWW